MYQTLKRVVVSGRYKLADMTKKIDTMWAASVISDDERDELISLSQKHLDYSTQAPEQTELYLRLLEKYEDLEARIKKLEGNESETPSEDDEWPAWEPWDGISNKYQHGAKVTHNGVRYVSTFAGQNTWEPGTIGTDSLWKVSEEQDSTGGEEV